MSKKPSELWDAPPHTIAKIEILKGYLNAWLRILAPTSPGKTILYVDGFAGPGRYNNHPIGSPLCALQAVQSAIYSLGQKFVAKVHCAFIESDLKIFKMLEDSVAPYERNPSIGISKHCCTFAEGIESLKGRFPEAFDGGSPLFVFADPFGGTKIPFKIFADCMKGDRTELLINLDADGIGRIHEAVTNNKRDEQLTELFGDESWREFLTAGSGLKKLSLQVLNLYLSRLSLSGVRYTWPFAMRGKNDALNYYLVFATRHRLGLGKMKEAMKVIDHTGTYSFSDAHVGQTFFREGTDQVYADMLFKKFDGQSIDLDVADEFALKETPLLNAKALLRLLEEQGRLKVVPVVGCKRHRGQFPPDKVYQLQFGQFAPNLPQERDLFA